MIIRDGEMAFDKSTLEAKDKISLKGLKPGKYTYICLMPEHGTTLDMTGILSVK